MHFLMIGGHIEVAVGLVCVCGYLYFVVAFLAKGEFVVPFVVDVMCLVGYILKEILLACDACLSGPYFAHLTIHYNELAKIKNK